MTLTDTHCHLYLDKFKDDLDQVLQRAVDVGVKHIWLPAIDWNSLEQMTTLNHPVISFYKMAGIHPCDVQNNWPVDEERLYKCGKSDKYVAIGETGLDYYWSRNYIKEQKESLILHCRVAKDVQKPVILHNRESTSDLLDIIENEQDGSLKGIWHCFTGSYEEAKRALDLGLYVGIGGVLTFKNAGVEKVVKKLPLNKLLLETDAPFLAPDPKRGKRNEPSYVVYTAQKLAELKDVSLEEIADVTAANAFELFGVKTETI